MSAAHTSITESFDDWRADRERDLVTAWWSRFEDQKVRVRDLITLPSHVLTGADGVSDSPRGRASALGQFISRMRDRDINGFTVHLVGTPQKTAVFRLERTGESR